MKSFTIIRIILIVVSGTVYVLGYGSEISNGKISHFIYISLKFLLFNNFQS